jgi:hypothetical protein
MRLLYRAIMLAIATAAMVTAIAVLVQWWRSEEEIRRLHLRAIEAKKTAVESYRRDMDRRLKRSSNGDLPGAADAPVEQREMRTWSPQK